MKFIEIDRRRGISVPAEHITMVRDGGDGTPSVTAVTVGSGVNAVDWWVDRPRSEIIAELGGMYLVSFPDGAIEASEVTSMTRPASYTIVETRRGRLMQYATSAEEHAALVAAWRGGSAPIFD
jgi:hypothetical protein